MLDELEVTLSVGVAFLDWLALISIIGIGLGLLVFVGVLVCASIKVVFDNIKELFKND